MRHVVHSILPDLEVASIPETSEDDVDISLIEHNLSLTIAERIRQHDRALAMANAFRRAGAKAHGISAPGVTETPCR
jgi:hypothetical protein